MREGPCPEASQAHVAVLISICFVNYSDKCVAGTEPSALAMAAVPEVANIMRDTGLISCSRRGGRSRTARPVDQLLRFRDESR